MTKRELVLAVLSTSEGEPWTPVQVQKIFFLLDQKIPTELEGPHWDFTPYDYGPFDSGVYRQIERLAQQGLAHVDDGSFGSMRKFMLTASGQEAGEAALSNLPDETRDYMERLSKWVRSLSFQQLVSAVYKQFPKMRERSIFQE